MSKLRTYALLPPEMLNSLRTDAKYFGDKHKLALSQLDQKISQILNDPRLSEGDKKLQYASVMGKLRDELQLIQSKTSQPAVAPPANVVQEQGQRFAEPRYTGPPVTVPPPPPVADEQVDEIAMDEQPIVDDNVQTPAAPSTSGAAQPPLEQSSNVAGASLPIDVENSLAEFAMTLRPRSQASVLGAVNQLSKLPANRLKVNDDYSFDLNGEHVPKSDIREVLRRLDLAGGTVMPGASDYRAPPAFGQIVELLNSNPKTTGVVFDEISGID